MMTGDDLRIYIWNSCFLRHAIVVHFDLNCKKKYMKFEIRSSAMYESNV